MTYDCHNLVYDVDSLEQAFQNVGALECLFQLELGAPHHHLVAELHEVLYHFLEREGAGTSLDQGHVVDGETRLQRGIFEEHIEHHVGIGSHLERNLNPDALAVRKLKQVRNPLYLLVAHQLADVGDHIALVHHIRDFGHHYGLASVVCNFYLGAGTYHYAAAAGAVGVHDALAPHNDAARREIGALDIFHQLLGGDIGIVDVGADCVAYLAEVVGCHIGGHTHRDAAGAVKEQQWQFGGEHGRLLQGVVEVERHIHGILVYVGKNILRHLGKLGLGVTHSRYRVAVHGTEVALAEHQGITLVPGLRQAGHGVVNA